MNQQEYRRQLWRDVDSGWALTVEFMTAVGVWAGIGWLFDQWFDTPPWLMIAGVVLGFVLGSYLVYLRYMALSREEELKYRAR